MPPFLLPGADYFGVSEQHAEWVWEDQTVCLGELPATCLKEADKKGEARL